ncbi:hypothetical protein Q4574_08230 [Aliiglaciecola sp. 3_MG-2023]|uniref:hypothetical protein n=1 Tax=Aliiglaciecola sp. 3_MG-2023 TaxID=3062644 RepID=UPI0026E42AF1|nr:hypothetical protein [Aliiglaciecola sp. 3_MG-2023]MDO6693269.1 hypothetical protein [Aliiglaciecola sp. 3_MG-2023]
MIFHVPTSLASGAADWILIDNFEAANSLDKWTKADTKNDTSPKVHNPQISERRKEVLGHSENVYLIKKPAAEGVVGNRKALTYAALPTSVDVGEIYTFYTRINVESFPNNHAFGISNMSPKDIELNDYNAFEATLRVTDKTESNGLKNTGVLMVKTKDGYANIQNNQTGQDAQPLVPGQWYEIWYVVDNRKTNHGGQTYDVYVKGGSEFPEQQKVYSHATFRMQREQPLTHFLMNCNTGPKKQPYGNGGLKYDDLYMSEGLNLKSPLK